MHPLPTYVHTAPSEQNALDIFAGEWTSSLPPPWGHLHAGPLPLFADPRISWAIEQFDGVNGKTILELGPLEGAHSFILDRSHAEEVVAIEGNSNAFLRCLVLKEILDCRSVRFLCGDFASYLRSTERRFDVVFASGVLYHQIDPMRLIADIARVSSAVYIWTHYYDADLVASNPAICNRVGTLEEKNIADFSYSQIEYRYEQSLEWSGSCGGTHSACYWLSKDAILGGLKYFGFDTLSVAYDEPFHKHGPSLAIVAKKSSYS